MLENQDALLSTGRKRLILIADDEMINREMLAEQLKADYDILLAENGAIALELIQQHQEKLSLILLDLRMPVMTGQELLSMLQDTPELRHIPVIVLTSDHKAEVECLRLGAIDFIPKPYPDHDVIMARILRTIELFEDRQTIQYTERDPLTGLYNREYFYRYTEQFDRHHPDTPMDALVMDVNHFHLINERYGKAFGDQVLRDIADQLRSLFQGTNSMVCRQESDTFLVYCPHRENGEDYRKILDAASLTLTEHENTSSIVRLRMGVYPDVDKTLDPERRFDRAKNASDTIRGSFTKSIGIYDNELHKEELFHERLIDDFRTAIEEHQFLIYYQPKFNVCGKRPILSSAEALVRWQHPELGMISPGVFIPLFENNGLIQELDAYVWRTAAAQQREWIDRLGTCVPVSVNVSRIDVYDTNLVDNLHHLMDEYRIDPALFHLEITESAYTTDSSQIITTVKQLRSLGFQIEMDDFGTGYSSLNMISSLPIDALKLDMKFISSTFQEGNDTRIFEIIVDIADYLSVPIIVEGVETEDQYHTLKAMGCDIIQGYYFSRPIPKEQYEAFMLERTQSLQDEAMEALEKSHGKTGELPLSTSIVHALTSAYEAIYYVDILTNQYVQFSTQGLYETLHIERSGTDFFADTQRNIPRVVYPEDRERMAEAMKKPSLLNSLTSREPFTLTYRLSISGKPVYYSLRAVTISSRGNHHIVIGVSNVADQVESALSVEDRNVEFYDIAQALSSDFESIYYVNLDSDEYTRFSAQDAPEDTLLDMNGISFFEDMRHTMLHLVHHDDQALVCSVIDKESLLHTLDRMNTISVMFRMMLKGTPTYYQMKIVRVRENGNYIVVGVSNQSSQAEHLKAYEAAREQSEVYGRLAQALSQDYYSIYLVHVTTDEFTEYASGSVYQTLHVQQSGTNFFEDCRRNILRRVFPEDLDKALSVWDKPRLMKELQRNRTFSSTYRLLFDDVPVYINCKIILIKDDGDDPQLIIGISNVDAQMRREQELIAAREQNMRDALTGVKSKSFFAEMELEINRKIEQGEAQPFAITVCDVNNLKNVNDTMGHMMGDQFIKNAAMELCNIFEHSPVFRFGGDEFVVLLRGRDYEAREHLMSVFHEKNRQEQAAGGLVIAAGISDYLPGEDASVEDVFIRADAAMYRQKKVLKGLA